MITDRVDLSPEAVFQSFLGLVQLLVVTEVVEVGQDAHYLRETVHLADVEELKRFHLKAKASVDE